MDFEEELKKLSDIFEMVLDYYGVSRFRLENEEHKKIVQSAKEIYEIFENNNDIIVF